MVKDEFSDKEVFLARVFCVVVGVLLVPAGYVIARQNAGSELALAAAGLLAASGSGIAVFGAFSSRRACVGVASWILALL